MILLLNENFEEPSVFVSVFVVLFVVALVVVVVVVFLFRHCARVVGRLATGFGVFPIVPQLT